MLIKRKENYTRIVQKMQQLRRRWHNNLSPTKDLTPFSLFLSHLSVYFPQKSPKPESLETARIILGHRSAAITEVYAELDQQQALEAIVRVG